MYRHTSLYCPSLNHTLHTLHGFCFCFTFEVLGQPYTEQSMGTIFQTAFTHSVALCHLLVILTIFQTILLLLHLLWRAVIIDL